MSGTLNKENKDARKNIAATFAGNPKESTLFANEAGHCFKEQVNASLTEVTRAEFESDIAEINGETSPKKKGGKKATEGEGSEGEVK